MIQPSTESQVLLVGQAQVGTPFASQFASQQRLLAVKELWLRSKPDQLEIGRLLYEERAERRSVGGAHVEAGFHQWLRDAGIPKTSAYRRIAEYEVSIGERTEEDQFDNPVKPAVTGVPVPTGTTSTLPNTPTGTPTDTRFTIRFAIDRWSILDNGNPTEWFGKTEEVAQQRCDELNWRAAQGLKPRIEKSWHNTGGTPFKQPTAGPNVTPQQESVESIVEPVVELKEGMRVLWNEQVYEVVDTYEQTYDELEPIKQGIHKGHHMLEIAVKKAVRQ